MKVWFSWIGKRIQAGPSLLARETDYEVLQIEYDGRRTPDGTTTPRDLLGRGRATWDFI